MTTLPQLRLRTEYTFREAFGPVNEVAAAAAAAGASVAAIVDKDTWGHVRWVAACKAAGITPAFGTEVVVPRGEDGMRPTAWVLAERGRIDAFYRFSSALRCKAPDPSGLLAGRPGVRFAGAALEDPELFDYVDLNPGSPLARRRAVALARRTGRPLVVTSDNAYPLLSDHSAFMAIAARERVTPQHILTSQELAAAMPDLDASTWTAALRGTHEAAERLESALPTAPLIRFEGDLRALVAAGREERLRLGHLDAWTEEHEARVQRELSIIEQKQFQSYFLVVADLVRWAKQRMLVGPARGSSAGSLVCYLLRITEVNPLQHSLLFERFIDLTRNDLPDIDIDFSDTKRDQIFVYLAERYGREHVARIGNVSTLQPRSVMAEVCKRMGIDRGEAFPVLNALIEYSSGDSRYGKGLEDTLNNTDAGQHFMSRHPEAAVMGRAEGHAWHTSVHAAGVIVSNVAVNEHCTVDEEGVAHIDKEDSKKLNLLKIDALGLRTLGVIEDSGCVTAEQLYALTLDDPAAFAVLNARRYAGVFQFEGHAQRSLAAQVRCDKFETIDHLTALARPGPLGSGAGARYVLRAGGEERITYRNAIVEPYVSGTMGIILYQEQVMTIGRVVGRLSWEDVTKMRHAMSGRKGVEFFDQMRTAFLAGAAENGLSTGDAEAIWEEINTFGAWGMNKSHTCSYSIIAYWCLWMKAHHPLEYAAACLRAAKDDTQAYEMLRELDAAGVRFTPFDPERSGVDWRVVDGELLGGYQNLVGYGPAKAVAAVEARRLGTATDKSLARIAAAPVRYSELYPIRAAYADLYAHPERHGCREGSRILLTEEFPDEGDVLFIAKVTRKERRDDNEAVRLARRKGRVRKGPTLFADIWVMDDCGLPVLARVERWDYEPLGRMAVERLEAGKDVLLIRGERVRGYPMVRVLRLRCLTNPAALGEDPS